MRRCHFALAGLTLAILTGCTTTRTSDTARTAMEQLLISNAVDQSLDKFHFASLYGRKVFIEEKYLDCVDKGYLLGSIRERILVSGGSIVAKAEESDVTLEIRSGGLGTDNLEAYVGTPNISVPGIMPVELPEIKFWNRKSQMGTAKIGILAYETKTGMHFAHGGQALARSDDNKWFILGIGPFQDGTVRNEVNYGTESSVATTRGQQTRPGESEVLIGARSEWNRLGAAGRAVIPAPNAGNAPPPANANWAQPAGYYPQQPQPQAPPNPQFSASAQNSGQNPGAPPAQPQR